MSGGGRKASGANLEPLGSSRFPSKPIAFLSASTGAVYGNAGGGGMGGLIAQPPPAKKRMIAAQPQADRTACGQHQFAGALAEQTFPDSKTTLNNAVQQHLRLAGSRLDYAVTRLPGGVFRCHLEVPVPEPHVVVGEGLARKDAEKRAAAAACQSLYDMEFMDMTGKRLHKHQQVADDLKPKPFDLPLPGQLQLYHALCCLDDRDHASITDWGRLVGFYGSQEMAPHRDHLAKQVLESSKTGNSSFKLSLENRRSSRRESGSESSAEVVLPSVVQQELALSDGRRKHLAALSCPSCREQLSLIIAHLSNNASPGHGEADYRMSAMAQVTTQCAFTGSPYSPLSQEESVARSTLLKRLWEEREERFQDPPPGSPQHTAQKLPIQSIRNQIISEINTHPVVVISGMTGSGKTTQVPQFIFDNYIKYDMGCDCNIVVTQPRRISAISIAERVAAERDEQLGETVGYQVRLESRIPRQPGRILFCTTGILLMKLRKNPTLAGVSHVLVDEVHERDINSDFLLILLKQIVLASSHGNSKGPKVILMSASFDTHLYTAYFKSPSIPLVPCVKVEGFCYPVTDHFIPQLTDEIRWKGAWHPNSDSCETNTELVTALVVHISRTQPPGAVLVFLPGWDDISFVQDALNSRLNRDSHQILPLHSMLSSTNQHLIFKRPPSGVRKVILATNIAESSVTIDDVVYVVNTGTVKVKSFDPLKKMSCLATQWASRASVIQRRGRAGRCQPGRCYNLFTSGMMADFASYEVPEMLRVPLEDIVLQAKTLKPEERVQQFLAMALDPPSLMSVGNAVSTLMQLGALDQEEQLTPVGQALAELPIEPRVGRMILLASVLGTLDPILTIAASVGYKDPFVSPSGKQKLADEVRSKMAHGSYSDHLLLSKAYSGWLEALSSGTDYEYVRDSFLHRGTLKMIQGMRDQFLSHLQSLGLSKLSSCDTHSHNRGMLRGVLTAGLYPNVMRMAKMLESAGGVKSGGKKRVRNGFKTSQDGRVMIHPSSVNHEKNFPSQWFVYYEKIKTSKVFIRDSSLVHSLHLLLFAGKSLDIISQSGSVCVVGLDGSDWVSVEVTPIIARLLKACREAITMVTNASLSSQAQLPLPHVEFLSHLASFLSTHASI